MDRLAGPRQTKLLTQLALTQQTRDAGEGPQVFRVGLQRREQGEHQIHGLVVHRLERSRLVQTHEHTPHAGQAWQACVRHGYAMAHARRPGRFALEQGVQHLIGIEAEIAGGDIGDSRQNLTLAAGSGARRNGARLQQISNIHSLRTRENQTGCRRAGRAVSGDYPLSVSAL